MKFNINRKKLIGCCINILFCYYLAHLFATQSLIEIYCDLTAKTCLQIPKSRSRNRST